MDEKTGLRTVACLAKVVDAGAKNQTCVGVGLQGLLFSNSSTLQSLFNVYMLLRPTGQATNTTVSIMNL